MRNAPRVFDGKRAAERLLSLTETQIMRGEWIDPERAKVTLGHYADQWIIQRPGLRPRTVVLYRWLLRKHIDPDLGGVELGKLSTAVVRQWRADRLGAGVSESVTAKAYRLFACGPEHGRGGRQDPSAQPVPCAVLIERTPKSGRC
jgi:hypothetical protein